MSSPPTLRTPSILWATSLATWSTCVRLRRAYSCGEGYTPASGSSAAAQPAAALPPAHARAGPHPHVACGAAYARAAVALIRSLRRRFLCGSICAGCARGARGARRGARRGGCRGRGHAGQGEGQGAGGCGRRTGHCKVRRARRAPAAPARRRAARRAAALAARRAPAGRGRRLRRRLQDRYCPHRAGALSSLRMRTRASAHALTPASAYRRCA
jgi:hypothetical protein